MDKIKKFGEFCNIHHNKVNETEIKRNTMSPINVGELKMLDDQEEIEKCLPIVWDMLEKSYENIGGLQSYRDYNDFKKKRHQIMVVKDFNNDDLLACATFRRIEGSLKMTVIGCNQENNGKLALQQIIQHTISELELLYWTEVSGAIEHYFKKPSNPQLPSRNDIELKEKRVDTEKDAQSGGNRHKGAYNPLTPQCDLRQYAVS